MIKTACAILKDEEQMKEINKKLEKLKSGCSTKSVRDDLKRKGDMIFSEESSRVIYEVGNLELMELRQTSATIQCLKHVPEGLNLCPRGVWLRPIQDAMDRIKARSEALITLYYRANFHSRGKRHEHNQWQKDHAKAVGAIRGAKKRGDHPSILSRWQNEEIYRASQLAHGLTETFVKCLDYLTTVDINHDAPASPQKKKPQQVR